MKKKLIALALLSSILTLTACNNDKGVTSTPNEQPISTKEQSPESTTAEQNDSISTKKASIQSNLPFDELYPDPTIRKYAEKFIGIKASDFTLKNAEGKDVSLSDFKGKNVILEMAQTTCHVCQDAQPKLNEFKKANPDLEIIQVFNEPLEPVNDFLKSTNSTESIHTLHGDAYEVFNDYEVEFVPILLFIDKEGMIQLIHVGQIDIDYLKLNTDLAFS